MARTISTLKEFHVLDLDTRLRLKWLGSEFHDLEVTVGNTQDGYRSPHYIELCGEKGPFMMGSDIFRQGCCFEVL